MAYTNFNYESIEKRFKNGFLPSEEPLNKLPEEFYLWDEISGDLGVLLSNNKARSTLSRIPEMDIDLLETEGQKERALGILTQFSHAAIHESWKNGSHSILPAALAKPLVKLSRKMNRKPVMTYSSHGLNNWNRLNKTVGIEVGNIRVLRNFYGGLDENWFVATHVQIESMAAGLLRFYEEMKVLKERDDVKHIVSVLNESASIVSKMTKSLSAVRDNCDPDIFFTRVQPFMRGMNKVTYEGVGEYSGVPQNHPGGSGAQSTIMPFLDAMLGIHHKEDQLSKYLILLRQYMPQADLQFLSTVESECSLREYVLKSSETLLIQAYNELVNSVGDFREEHIKISIDYIHKPAAKYSSDKGEEGTGGSPYMSYLRKHREETYRHKI